jgi:hypothetical protein
MGKITEIKFSPTTNFQAGMNLVNKTDKGGLIRKHDCDYYSKSFKTQKNLIRCCSGYSKIMQKPFESGFIRICGDEGL